MNDLFVIESVRETEGGYDVAVRLDPEHIIYKAHFPGEPITPGVCILQMAVKVLSQALGMRLCVQRMKNVKFLQILVPGVAKDIVWRLRDICIGEEAVTAQCVLAAGDSVIAKLSLICRKS